MFLLKSTCAILLLFAFCLSTIVSFGQDYPEPTNEKYKKVMSSAFAKDYEDCPVTITAEYFKEGYLKGYRKPRKLKKMYFFQCVAEGEEGTSQPFQKGLSGDFFVIDKKMADQVIEFNKGDKLELTGTTFTQNYYGTEVNTFFKVTEIKKVE